MSLESLKSGEAFETRISVFREKFATGYRPASVDELHKECGNCEGSNCSNCENIYEVKAVMLVPHTITQAGNELVTLEARYFENEEEAVEYNDWLIRKWIFRKKGSC